MSERAVARAKPAGGGERGKLVAAEVGLRLDGRVQLDPGAVDGGSRRERQRVVRDVAEACGSFLVDRRGLTCRLLRRNGLDECHGASFRRAAVVDAVASQVVYNRSGFRRRGMSSCLY